MTNTAIVIAGEHCMDQITGLVRFTENANWTGNTDQDSA